MRYFKYLKTFFAWVPFKVYFIKISISN